MIIRQAQMADLDAIYAIELENFSPEEAISREILAKHIETIPSTFLVAEKNGKILGYLEGPVRPERHLHDVSFTLEIEDYHTSDGGFISLTSLSISKEAQGLGVGKALLEAMKEIAIADKRHGINLTCHDYLIAYYEQHDFVNEGRSASTYADEVWFDMVWENPQI
ncbi:GNAT family N-acetyltransferase [Streptococcus cristatus]|uniref:Acetyltransferase (GNAT) family protein n=1 Tax=Streptococcus cristatus TaxID=45634 RepID=A0A3R9KZD2_STRCR|nr:MULTISPECIES: GNAT family N-acetyltransferase [Streptococcus]MDL2432139.1 GNAT family N-acetyltransferase [Streptococcus sp. SC1]RSJ92442.1 Acetyltransferase (GNAT) family protein [Streptococcus cristatus]